MRTSSLPLILLSTSHGMNHLLQLILPTILPSLISEFQISYYTAGLLVASFVLPYSLAQVPFGYLSDRRGHKNIMVAGLILYSTGTLLCGVSQNIIQLGIAQLLAGIGGASYHPIGIPLIFLAVERRKLGESMGFHQTGGAIGSFVAPVASAYVAVTFSWRYSFFIFSLIGLLIALLLWLGIEEPKTEHKETSSSDLRKRLLNMKILRLILIIFLFGLVQVIAFRGLMPFLTTYLMKKHNVELGYAAQLLSLLQIMGILGSPVFGKLSDTTGRRIMLGLLLVGQGVLMYLITWAPTNLLIILLGAMGLVVFGCLTVTDTWITEISEQSVMGTLVGVAMTASFLSGAIVNPIVGYLADNVSFDFAFQLLSLTNLLGLPILKFAKYK
ncbi:MAG: MFS transporter [Candidatus Bathyarchaeia archaeon]